MVEPEITKRTCQDCKYRCAIDYGYSNYTTEGTEFWCAKDAHPNGHFDEFYGEDARLQFAAQCPSFEAGEGITMDCDQEGLTDLTPDQKVIWEMYMAVQSR